MKTSTKIFASIMSFLALLTQVPTFQQPVMHFVDAHPAISIGLGAITSLMALLHNPQAAALPADAPVAGGK